MSEVVQVFFMHPDPRSRNNPTRESDWKSDEEEWFCADQKLGISSQIPNLGECFFLHLVEFISWVWVHKNPGR